MNSSALIKTVAAGAIRISFLRNIRCIRKNLDFFDSMGKNIFRLAFDFRGKK